MKVGSLVECIHPYTPDELDIDLIIATFGEIKDSWYPKGGQIYKVRGLLVPEGIYLEGIVGPKLPDGIEVAMDDWRFKEVQPPPDIEEEARKLEEIS